MYRSGYLDTKVFHKNPPDFLDGERVPLAGVAGTDDELRCHPVDMGALILDYPVVPRFDFHARQYGNYGVSRYPRPQRQLDQGLEQWVIR